MIHKTDKEIDEMVYQLYGLLDTIKESESVIISELSVSEIVSNQSLERGQYTATKK